MDGLPKTIKVIREEGPREVELHPPTTNMRLGQLSLGTSNRQNKLFVVCLFGRGHGIMLHIADRIEGYIGSYWPSGFRAVNLRLHASGLGVLTRLELKARGVLLKTSRFHFSDSPWV